MHLNHWREGDEILFKSLREIDTSSSILQPDNKMRRAFYSRRLYNSVMYIVMCMYLQIEDGMLMFDKVTQRHRGESFILYLYFFKFQRQFIHIERQKDENIAGHVTSKNTQVIA